MKNDTAKRLGAFEKRLGAIDVQIEQLGKLLEASRAPQPSASTEAPASVNHVERALIRVTELATTLRHKEAMGRWDDRDAQIAHVMLEDLAVVAADLRQTTNGANEQLTAALRELRKIRRELDGRPTSEAPGE